MEISDDPPGINLLNKVYDIPIYDAQGSSRSFGTLFDPEYATHERQLIIFVRHFFCPACQAYVKAVSEGISMQEYFGIPIPTAIYIISCGQPDLIRHYKSFTGCPYPIFTDPTRRTFKLMGMNTSLDIGKERPEYMKDLSIMASSKGLVKTLKKSLQDSNGLRKRDLFRGGHMMQVGGEFLFEDGEVIWCNRMKNYRSHAEVKVLRTLLQLDQ